MILHRLDQPGTYDKGYFLGCISQRRIFQRAQQNYSWDFRLQLYRGFLEKTTPFSRRRSRSSPRNSTVDQKPRRSHCLVNRGYCIVACVFFYGLLEISTSSGADELAWFTTTEGVCNRSCRPWRSHGKRERPLVFPKLHTTLLRHDSDEMDCQIKTP